MTNSSLDQDDIDNKLNASTCSPTVTVSPASTVKNVLTSTSSYVAPVAFPVNVKTSFAPTVTLSATSTAIAPIATTTLGKGMLSAISTLTRSCANDDSDDDAFVNNLPVIKPRTSRKFYTLMSKSVKPSVANATFTASSVFISIPTPPIISTTAHKILGKRSVSVGKQVQASGSCSSVAERIPAKLTSNCVYTVASPANVLTSMSSLAPFQSFSAKTTSLSFTASDENVPAFRLVNRMPVSLCNAVVTMTTCFANGFPVWSRGTTCVTNASVDASGSVLLLLVPTLLAMLRIIMLM